MSVSVIDVAPLLRQRGGANCPHGSPDPDTAASGGGTPSHLFTTDTKNENSGRWPDLYVWKRVPTARRQVANVDRDLVVAAQGGDQTAFVELIRPRSARLLAMAQRIMADSELAEDTLQDALVIAWRDLRSLRDPGLFDAWLRRLIVNLCIRHASRERHRMASLRVLPIEGPSAPDELHAVAVRDQLERGFRRLPPVQRATLVLHHLIGYSPAEIADALGIPPGTARSRLHNAQLAMRAALEAEARLAPAGRGLK